MIKSRHLSLIALLTGGCMAATLPASQSADAADTKIIRLSVDNPAGNDRASVEQKFADLVNKLSGGRLKVEIYFNGTLGGSESTAIQSLKAGGAEMAIVGTANFTQFDNRWSMFDLPFLFSGPKALYRYVEGDKYAKLVESTAERQGLRYIFPYYDGWRELVTTRKPVNTLAEENGLKLRATGSPVEIAYDRAFGAKPVSVAWNETYLALKEGLVDGMMIGYTDLVNFKMGDAVSYGTTLNVAPELVVGFIRESFLRTLPPDLQDVVVKAGQETERFAEAVYVKEDAAARQALQKMGMRIFDPPESVRQAWIVAAQPIYAKYRNILPEQEQMAIQHSTAKSSP